MTDTAPSPDTDLAAESGLNAEVIAHIWCEHANCNWTSNGINVIWSCGILHDGPIHMQPTTRHRHFAALLMTQIEADRAIAKRDLAARDRRIAAEAWGEGMRHAANLDFGVSRGDMISVLPACHKRGCRCNSGSGDLVVLAVAGALRSAIHKARILANPYRAEAIREGE